MIGDPPPASSSALIVECVWCCWWHAKRSPRSRSNKKSRVQSVVCSVVCPAEHCSAATPAALPRQWPPAAACSSHDRSRRPHTGQEFSGKFLTEPTCLGPHSCGQKLQMSRAESHLLLEQPSKSLVAGRAVQGAKEERAPGNPQQQQQQQTSEEMPAASCKLPLAGWCRRRVERGGGSRAASVVHSAHDAHHHAHQREGFICPPLLQQRAAPSTGRGNQLQP